MRLRGRRGDEGRRCQTAELVRGPGGIGKGWRLKPIVPAGREQSSDIIKL